MLEARKENKVYSITEQQKKRYLQEGFDIYEEGKVIEYTPLKKIKYSDHVNTVKKLNEKHTAEIEELRAAFTKEIDELRNAKATAPTAENVLEALIEYAESKSIDIGSCTSANGVLTKILEAEKEA